VEEQLKKRAISCMAAKESIERAHSMVTLKPAQYPLVAFEPSDAVAKNMEIFLVDFRDKCLVMRVVLGEELHKKW
jgi:hypothetical protein